MNTKELCPVCGEGHVTSLIEMVESEYKGQMRMLPSHYQLCDTCHSDFAGASEGRLNKRAIMAFRKSVDGLLTGAEILALRKRYGMTQDQAARLFGGGPVAFSKYENDDVAQSESMDSLLRLVRRSEAAFGELVEEKGLGHELVLKRPNAERRIFRTQKTDVVYVSAWPEVSLPAHTAQSHRYTAHSSSCEPERSIWMQ